ncbi:MAG: PilC/PilY family type IV pilus protein [Luteimonas sp.]
MIGTSNTQSGAWKGRVAAFAVALFATLGSSPAQSSVTIPDIPLFTVAVGKPNVLLVLDNSNSMDESASGAAVGSDNASSKSEIARGVIKDLVKSYTGRINMGLMAYQQGAASAFYLHNSPYDASYDPANYDPTFIGDRASKTKKYRMPNPTSPGDYIYYNVALPYYSGKNEGNLYCYSAGSGFPSGPNAGYACYSNKTGGSDAAPAVPGSGYSNFAGNYNFGPTDSDFAQGISSFGAHLVSTYVARTWYRNDSPGRGYLHVPIKALDATQASAITAKLACNIPNASAPCTSAGLQNAGLTPIEGTLYTAKDYLAGKLSKTDEGYTASCYPLPETCKKNYVILLTDGLPSTDKSGKVVSDPAVAVTKAADAATALHADGVLTYVIGFALPYGVDPKTLDRVATAGGTNQAYNANDSQSLKDALAAIFSDIEAKSSSGSAVATNSTRLDTGSQVFSARYMPTDWTGSLDAYSIASGVVQSTPAWSASIPTSRSIITLDAIGADTTFPNASQLATLGSGVVAYLKGDQTGEGSTYRVRKSLLGDIVDSSPVYVDQGKDKKTIYVGANDGMLHAFNAENGVERFAYVPVGQDFNNLKTFSSPTYAHKFFVDGELEVSTERVTPGERILVGTLGRGGRSIFAIDVTDPTSPNVLWEKTASNYPNLGQVLGKPVIANVNTGKSAVIIGNGVNGASDQSELLVLDLHTGALIKELTTGAGPANGMSTPRGWDSDRSGTVDVLYAGDLLGNVWKFDVSDPSPSKWGSALTSGKNAAPLFVAMDAGGTRQPITGSLSVGINPSGFDRWVFFGTGSYMKDTDPASKSVQTWYGIIDNDSTAVSGRSALKQRSTVVQTTADGRVYRAFETQTAGDMSGKAGWYVDLTDPDGTARGERMVTGVTLFGSVLLASSIIPSSEPCVAGGSGFINAIDAFTGTNVTTPFFDLNGDGSFNASDKINNGTTNVPVGSIDLGIGMPTTPLVIDKILVANGTGALGGVGVANPVASGRIAWREILKD